MPSILGVETMALDAGPTTRLESMDSVHFSFKIVNFFPKMD